MTAIPNPIAQSELRPHQVTLIDDLDRTLVASVRHLVVQAPTGFGKTMVGATLARRALDDGRRTLFTVPALSLIDQTVEKFRAEGIRDVGVIQADHDLTDWSRPVQIASVQTLMRRQMPPIDLVMVDEVHRWFDKYEEWLQGPWSHLPVIGLTATPWTKGLGKHFDRLIIGATTSQLIDTGYLSKFRVFAPASPDLTGVRTLAGDYREDDLADAMDKAPLVADVVDTWIDRAAGRPTLLFAVNRAHAKHLQQRFIDAGVPAGYIDCYTEANVRKEIARQFHAGEVKVVCNVGCLTTGIDWDVRCIVLARPTKSEILFVQMVGRGLRTADGKDDCLVLDHSDNHIRLGFVTDIHYDVLDDGRPRPKAEPKAIEKLPKPCPRCTFLKPPKNSGLSLLRLHPDAAKQGGGSRWRTRRTEVTPRSQADGRGRAGHVLFRTQGDRPGARLRARLGIAPIQKQVRILSTLEMERVCNRDAVRHDAQLGQVPADRLRESEGTMNRKRNRIDGHFNARLIELLESPVFRVLSLSAHRVLNRVSIELGHHGGNDNGKLPVTFEQFEEYGIHRHAIAPAIRELEALGLIEVTQHGRSGVGALRRPNLFRLTCVNCKSYPNPTHEWRRIPTIEAAELRARVARKSNGPRPPIARALPPKPMGNGQHRRRSDAQGKD